MDKEKLCNCKQAAFLIGKSEPNLLYMRKHEQGPGWIKKDGKIFYKLKDIIKWSKHNIFLATVKHNNLLERAEVTERQMEK